MSPIPVYVLVGGASRRFGVDKATTLVDGEPWALHVGRRLAASDTPIVLVGAPLAEPIADLRTVPDAAGAAGPLAGVLAALDDRRQAFGEGRLVLASCDLVRPESEWLAPLHALHDNDEGLSVAAYHDARGWQPFPCVAHTRWRDELWRQITAGARSFQTVLGGPGVARAVWRGVAGGPPQANTPDELGDLLARRH
ncbi:molybdopterin-guanine dinucleotide biosynthesis protein MobA [Botrimarina colliarenosi]|uniref:Molybdopterin-guanine dinucleotide biosynthesis protein MobA n=1 Tax=Botrimarina colliarenosi TaxID=2528001 RepID=A0A5C6ADZ1_9BACT|nr:NTP transferase domain-containing protein [Botrimarina colliarenosi]TWT98184.1 molybdopterin-guanine dinucleotide biosynthesis protein MobA [Botrimarina colliarenosi]